MSYKSLRAFGLAISLLAFSGCTSLQTREAEAPPPPQNLLGTTDEFQLVTELAIELAANHGGNHVLVVLEIDNTLMTLEQGSACSNGVMRPTQPDMEKQVRRMQDAGLKVIVVTSRKPGCRVQTMEELRRNGFSFRVSAWPPQDGYPEPFITEGGVRPVLYQNGVFFTSGQDKGLMLKALLAKNGDLNPALIVMADHEQADLNAVIKAFSWSGIKVHAWRYTREPAIASAQ